MLHKKHFTLPKIKVSRNAGGFFARSKHICSEPLISSQQAYEIRHRPIKSKHNSDIIKITQEEKIETPNSFPPTSERKCAVLKHSQTQNYLPTVLNKKLEGHKIMRRFKEMGEFAKRIPEIDPLECLYTNVPFIDHVHSDNIRRKREEIMKFVKPVYEDQNETFCERLQDTEILYAFE